MPWSRLEAQYSFGVEAVLTSRLIKSVVGWRSSWVLRFECFQPSKRVLKYSMNELAIPEIATGLSLHIVY